MTCLRYPGNGRQRMRQAVRLSLPAAGTATACPGATDMFAHGCFVSGNLARQRSQHLRARLARDVVLVLAYQLVELRHLPGTSGGRGHGEGSDADDRVLSIAQGVNRNYFPG